MDRLNRHHLHHVIMIQAIHLSTIRKKVTKFPKPNAIVIMDPVAIMVVSFFCSTLLPAAALYIIHLTKLNLSTRKQHLKYFIKSKIPFFFLDVCLWFTEKENIDGEFDMSTVHIQHFDRIRPYLCRGQIY